MSDHVRPPDEVFCMDCGPGTVMDADPGAHRLRCPRCGSESWLPALPVFVVTGASGTGKSTITGPLRGLLPGCLVVETDVILHVAALGWDTWRNTWLQLAHAAALGGQPTVLTGSLTPDQLERLPARKLIGPIHFALLDCPDDVLADRLRARPGWRLSSAEATIIQHQRFAAWLRANITPSFDTSTADAAEVADRVAAWVQALLPGTQGPTQSGQPATRTSPSVA
jgi:predicted kinase/ribosomal protein S27AE